MPWLFPLPTHCLKSDFNPVETRNRLTKLTLPLVGLGRRWPLSDRFLVGMKLIGEDLTRNIIFNQQSLFRP